MCKLAMRHNRACFAHLWGWKSSCKERKQASKQEKKYPPKQNAKHSPLDNYWSSSYGSLHLSTPKKIEIFLEKDLLSIQSMRSRIRALPLTKILNLERSFPSSFFPPPWPPTRRESSSPSAAALEFQPPNHRPPHPRLSLKGHFCGLLFSCFAFSPFPRPF